MPEDQRLLKADFIDLPEGRSVNGYRLDVRIVIQEANNVVKVPRARVSPR